MADKKARETPEERARSGYRPLEKTMTPALALAIGLGAFFAIGLGTSELVWRLSIGTACAIVAALLMYYRRIHAAAKELLAEERGKLDAYETDERSRAIDKLRRHVVLKDIDASDMLKWMRLDLSKTYIQNQVWMMKMAKLVEAKYPGEYGHVQAGQIADVMIETGSIETKMPEVVNQAIRDSNQSILVSMKLSPFGARVCDWLEDPDPNVNGLARKKPVVAPI